MQRITKWNEDEHNGRIELEKYEIPVRGMDLPSVKLERIRYIVSGDVNLIGVAVHNAKCRAVKRPYVDVIDDLVGIDMDVKNSIDDLCAELSQEAKDEFGSRVRGQNSFHIPCKIKNTTITRGDNPMILVRQDALVRVGNFRANVLIIFPDFWIKDGKRHLVVQAHEIHILPQEQRRSLLRPEVNLPINDPFDEVQQDAAGPSRIQQEAEAAAAAVYRPRRVRNVRTGQLHEPIRVERNRREEKELPAHFLAMIKDEDRDCPICIDRVENDAYMTPCFHLFHKACINEWKQRSTECPKCKQAI